MPGTILREDAEQFLTGRLQEFANNAFTAVQQVQLPQFSVPQFQIDPNEITQRLQQHAQDAWSAVQYANAQAPLQNFQPQIDPNVGVQPAQQPVVQPVQDLQPAFTAPATTSDVQTGLSPLDQAAEGVRQQYEVIKALRPRVPEWTPPVELSPQPLAQQVAQGALQRLDDAIRNVTSSGPSTGAGQALAGFDQGRQDLADQLATVPGRIQEAVGPGSALATGTIGDYLPTGAIAKTPIGAFVHTLRGPALLTDAEVLQTPEADTARQIITQFHPDSLATDADVADAARTLLTSQAVAMTGTGIGQGLDQKILQSLREGGLLQGPSPVRTPQGVIGNIVQGTKQSILSNPVSMVANVIGNTIDFARTPASLALGGRLSDAAAATHAVMQGLGVASDNTLSALAGAQRANLAEFASAIPLRSPIYRILSASDAFTRTLGELQGMAVQANRLLQDAGIKPSDPAAASYLADHAAELYKAGASEGAQSVFSQLGNIAAGRTGLDTVFNKFGRYKEGLLASPSLKDQGLGALLDVFVPFSGIPVRLVGIVGSRTPPGTQIGGIARMAQALKAKDMPAFQEHFGSTMLESMIQIGIAKAISDGNITGPQDPDHPSMIRIGGEWHSMQDLGGYALPMQVMAAWAEGYEKAGINQPAGTSAPEATLNRFGAALNASMVPFVKAIPGMDFLRLLNQVGQGSATGAALSAGQDVANRVAAPGIARFAENLMDPVARDVNRKGVQSLWEQPMSAIPGLANFLPEKIDPTTGDVLRKAQSSGPGMLLGARADVESPLTVEANRLNTKGYDISPPSTYPDKITISGMEVNLKPAEQRAVAAITGKFLAERVTPRLAEANYQQAPDDRKAQMMRAYLNAAEQARVGAVRDVIGVDELRQRMINGQKVAGRLTNQAAPPTWTPFVSSGGNASIDPNDPNAVVLDSYRRRAQDEAQTAAQRQADEDAHRREANAAYARGQLVNG